MKEVSDSTIDAFTEFLSDNLRQTCHEYKDGKIDYRYVYRKIKAIQFEWEQQPKADNVVDEEIEKLANESAQETIKKHQAPELLPSA